jgi:hypothetical protein
METTMKIQGLDGYPIAKIPYVTSSLLKQHRKIVTVFDPLKAHENPLSAIITRVGLLFSALFVYPALGILTLGGYLSAKICVKRTAEPEEKTDHGLRNWVNEQLGMAKDRFSSVSLNNKYWWCVEVEVQPSDKKLYSKANVAAHNENFRQFLTFDSFEKDKASKINPSACDITFKFILVEKNSDDNFNIYSYDRTSHSQRYCTGGFTANTSVCMEAARIYLNAFNIKCPLDKI